MSLEARIGDPKAPATRLSCQVGKSRLPALTAQRDGKNPNLERTSNSFSSSSSLSCRSGARSAAMAGSIEGAERNRRERRVR